MSPEQLWYWCSITDQIRGLLAVIAVSFLMGIGLAAMVDRKKTAILSGIISLGAIAIASFIPNKDLAREIAAIKYGSELQQKRVQDKLHFYKKELNKEKK